MSIPGYELTETYPYFEADGTHLFDKLRYARLSPSGAGRRKEFRYLDVATGRMRKPAGADNLLYRVPQLIKAVREGQTIHWSEGEKDCEALEAAGVIATSHHQGACHVTETQAAWLRYAAEIVLWVDKDIAHWEVGAYDAALRHKRLTAVGVDPLRIRFVKARGGAHDAYDHLQRYTVEQALPIDKNRLAAVAATYRVGAARWAGYRRG